MKLNDLLTAATEGMTVRRVFGEPIEAPGGLVIPVARVTGGAGGGVGDDVPGGQSGSGGGSGFRAAPVGVYRVTATGVSWHPAVNVNAIVIGAQAVVIVAAVVLLRRPRP